MWTKRSKRHETAKTWGVLLAKMGQKLGQRANTLADTKVNKHPAILESQSVKSSFENPRYSASESTGCHHRFHDISTTTPKGEERVSF